MSAIRIDVGRLEKRVDELEKKLDDKPKFQMFGRNYSQFGNLHSDFLMKTKGQVKVQFGNTFIDLIKDGKINVDVRFLYKVRSKDDIGPRNGLYVTDDGAVYLDVDGNIINLVGEIGTVYVSFMEPQETDSTQKHTALQNIGFLYNSLQDITDSSLKNGIIYVEQEQKLYIVSNGTLTEFKFEFPNPFTEQLVIQKNDTDIGSLRIVGKGKYNSLAFDSMYLYQDASTYIFETGEGQFEFRINGTKAFSFGRTSAEFYDSVQGQRFHSPMSNDEYGFDLYMKGNESYLIVDHLTVRKGIGLEDNVYPVYWSTGGNIILSGEVLEQDKYNMTDEELEELPDENPEPLPEEDEVVPDEEVPEEEENLGFDPATQYFRLYLKYQNTYQENDIIYFYVDMPTYVEKPPDTEQEEYDELLQEELEQEKAEGNEVPEFTPDQGGEVEDTMEEGEGKGLRLLTGKVIDADETEIVVAIMLGEGETLDDVPTVTNKATFLAKKEGEEKNRLVKFFDKGQDLLEYKEIDDEDYVKARYGDLTDLELKMKDNSGEKPIEGMGLYAKQGFFFEAAYTHDYVLPDDDCSSRFASTEWIKKSGTIDADLTFQDYEVNVQEYFQNADIKKAIDAQEQDTCKNYLAKYGFITIDKIQNTVSVFAKAKTEDDKWSYRALTVTLDTWEVLGNYLLAYTGQDAIQIEDDKISLLLGTPLDSETDIPVTFTQSDTGLLGTVKKTDIQSVVEGTVTPPPDITAGDGLQLTDTVMSVKINSAAAPTDNTKVTLVADSNGLSGYMSNSDIKGVVGPVSNDYTLPAATSSALGGVKLASDTKSSVDSPTISTTADRTYGVQVNNNGQLVVNVPWTDTATSGGYTLPEATQSTLGGVKLGSDQKQTQAAETVTSTEKRTYAVQNNNDGQLVVNVPWTDTTSETVDTSKFVESMDTTQLKKIKVVTELPALDDQETGVLYLVMS